METPQASTIDTYGGLVGRIHDTAMDMSGWLKFLGAVQIAVGIPTLVGLIGALYIWLGVLLWQAGTAAQSPDPEKLGRMMRKLKTFFVVTGVLAALSLIAMIVTLVVAGGTIFTVLQQ